MKRKRVLLTPKQRKFACDAFVDALRERDVDVGGFCVGEKHWHGLLRFRDDKKHRGKARDAQRLLGEAKGKSAFLMSKAKLIARGGVWAHRSRVRPVTNRAHALNITKYIPDHAKKGAAVYTPKAKPGPSGPGPSDQKRR